MTEIENKRKISLTTIIFIALIVGAATGIAIHYLMPAGNLRDNILIKGIFQLLGQAFIRLLQMLVVPLVFFSLSTGALSMGDTASLGKVGLKTLIFYLFTTAAAIAIALALATILNPGVGMDVGSVTASDVEIGEAPSLLDTILNIIPTNPIQALANGEMLQIIVFALLVGIVCAQLPEKLNGISKLLNEGNDLMMALTSLVMRLAPIGVFALIAKTFAELGFETLLPMLSYMGTVIGSLVVQLLLVYTLLLVIFTRLNPFKFFKKIAPAFAFGFSSASSGATIPISLQCTDNMGIPRKISAFTVPLGATINMDGTAIMQGVAVVFIANVYGIDLTMQDFMTVILTATLASVGTAGVPGVGLITLSMVLQSVGLPVEGIAMIMGIDRILDMLRTGVNISGDLAVTTIIAKQDGILDKKQYYDDKLVESSEEI